jgi:predicted GIY-YIG superfamily endonuclease
MAKGQKKQKLTPDNIRKLEEAFSIDATVLEACFYADISSNTYYRWIKENPALYDRFERLREKPVLTARQTVVKAIATDSEIAMKYLERKKKNEFSPRTEVDLKGQLKLSKLEDIQNDTKKILEKKK